MSTKRHFFPKSTILVLVSHFVISRIKFESPRLVHGALRSIVDRRRARCIHETVRDSSRRFERELEPFIARPSESESVLNWQTSLSCLSLFIGVVSGSNNARFTGRTRRDQISVARRASILIPLFLS